jgi:hypothetical protein
VVVVVVKQCLFLNHQHMVLRFVFYGRVPVVGGTTIWSGTKSHNAFAGFYLDQHKQMVL